MAKESHYATRNGSIENLMSQPPHPVFSHQVKKSTAVTQKMADKINSNLIQNEYKVPIVSSSLGQKPLAFDRFAKIRPKHSQQGMRPKVVDTTK